MEKLKRKIICKHKYHFEEVICGCTHFICEKCGHRKRIDIYEDDE